MLSFEEFQEKFGKQKTALLLLAWSNSLSLKQQTLEQFIEEYCRVTGLSVEDGLVSLGHPNIEGTVDSSIAESNARK